MYRLATKCAGKEEKVSGRKREREFLRKTIRRAPGAVLGKNIWEAWPLIIWEATTSRTILCPIVQY